MAVACLGHGCACRRSGSTLAIFSNRGPNEALVRRRFIEDPLPFALERLQIGRACLVREREATVLVNDRCAERAFAEMAANPQLVEQLENGVTRLQALS
jgi:hypothetical protein